MEQPDPILLVAQACCPQLLSLDDLLAIRCVCQAWRQSLGSAYCSTWRLPQSLWHTAADNIQFDATIRAAAASCKHAPCLLLDSGPGRPSIPINVWAGLLPQLRPWMVAGGDRAAKRLHLHLRNPASPTQLVQLRHLPWLHSLRLQHSHASIYSRHLSAIGNVTQLRELSLLMEMPKLELRSLAHQRLRRVPLSADCLSSLVRLERLELSCKAYTGDLLPDTLATFSSPAELAALRRLTHLSISELALPGPWSVEEWLRRLKALQSLQFVLQDDPATCANRSIAAGTSTAACTAGAGGAAAANAGLLGTGGLSAALAAAAQAAGKSRADQQLAVAQQNLLAGLQNLSSALQQAANSGAFGRVPGANSSGGGSSSGHHHQHHHQAPHHLSPAGPSASSSSGGAPPGNNTRLARSSSSTSTPDADAPAAAASSSDAAAAAAAAAAATPVAPLRPLLPVSFSTACPGLRDLVVANLYGDRCVKATVPTGLTRLVLHLANPTPGSVNGEQLAAVVLQAAESLLCLELGLGMRFSLSGSVMRGLKRGLKQLRDLTLIEGAQDHLEGLGCWCNLPRLTLVEGRCTVPLRGLYELSMRAAMGRTPGVLRYHGHARHVEELASRLGSALQELRLDSLAGLGSGYRSGGCGGGGADSGSGSSSGASSAAASPRASKRRHRVPGLDSDEDEGDEGSADGAGGEGAGGEAGCPPLPALAQLSSMTRLEVLGDQIGQLDTYGVLVLSSCKNLRVLSIQGREAWLSADLGVKEQLEWVAELPQLRQLRLKGAMLGRTKLSAAGSSSKDSSSASAAASAGQKGSGGRGSSSSNGVATSSSSASSPAGAAAPAVKGLGNGLGCAAAVSAPAAGKGTGRGPLVKDPEARAAAIAKARALEEEENSEKWQGAYAQVVSVAAMQLQDLQLKAVSGQLPAGAEQTRELAYEAAQGDAGVAVCLEELRRWLCEMLPNCRVWLD